MRRRTPITEIDKLKEAKAKSFRYSSFLDAEIDRGFPLDREMFCAAMDTWQSAMKEIFRIENDERLARIKKEGDILEREAYNRAMIGT